MSNLSYLSQYQPFADKNELNEAIADHLSRCKYDLSETDRDVFMMLSQYSVKYPGVSHLKVATIAARIKKSSITVRRSLNKLAKLRIIKKQSFLRRVSGGNGANLYTILPSGDNAKLIDRIDADDPTETCSNAGESAKEPFNSTKLDIVINNTYCYEMSDASHMTLSSPYRRFKDAVTQFVGEGNQKLVSRMYGCYLGQTKALRKAYEDDELMDVAVQGIMATFNASKTRKLRNIAGYFNGVFSNMLDRMCSDLMAELSGDV